VRFWFAPFFSAINYHEIRPQDVSQFEEHLRFFSRKYASVDVPKLERFFRDGVWSDDRPGLLISFDDGSRSHYEIAAPLLEKYGFTGWFFVPIQLMALGVRERTASEQQPVNVLTADQLSYLDQHHVVGSHTSTHCRLNASLSSDQLREEIIGSRDQMADTLGHPIRFFCWAGGEENSYSSEAARYVNRGYDFGFMTNGSFNTKMSDPMQIQRINIEADNPLWLVRFQLSGFMDIYYLRKRQRVNRLTSVGAANGHNQKVVKL
jgi:peptidoglycan/xylan/chitin deacetylase (PgdA/CDA1 family)